MGASPRWAAAAVALGVTMTACSGGPKSPRVATLGTITTTTATASGGADDLSKLQAYADCMRARGVAGFPDPTPGPNGQGGGFAISVGKDIGGKATGLDPQSATFKAAQSNCKSLLPSGGRTAGQLTAAQQQQLLDWAQCMRTHGMANFPDPDFSGGGVRIGAGANSGIDPQSPQFQSAQEACKSKMPSGFAKAGG